MTPHPMIPPGLFASPISFAIFCWPFLVAWLLWISGRVGHAQEFSYIGLGLSFLALIGCAQGLEPAEMVALGLESFVPFLLFMQLFFHDSSIGRLGGGIGERLPFLVVGCSFMGFLFRSTLAVTIAVGAGSVLLAWWDGRATRRAMPAWVMARLRLCGVVLGGLGATLLHGGAAVVTPESAQTLGIILSVVGVGMMAGLGSAATAAPELDLLDVGLRFAALTLMLHLAFYPLARHLMMVAGLLALFVTMVGRGHVFPLLPCLTGLGALAAATEQEIILLLLQAAALLSTSLRLGVSLKNDEYNTLPERAVLPVIGVVLLQLGHVLSIVVLGILLLCIALGIRGLRLVPMREGSALYRGKQGRYTQVLVALLMVVAVVGVCLSGQNILPEWHP
ncbi:hypothetical protein GS501_06910 [Saccharibacter sp. 17.LH.SD]|uniref:hypothetical protein n=1 Tax=Saccharibacter sp. 17.LH.SD TaxID=2689393 RepID=UPI00137038F5|nr:hypothetical protein [Saccharibacter sp. 17.LH.SD]MXV44765.1 hypothetical protein [Saccharibacter sp. 17.LH.SD]